MVDRLTQLKAMEKVVDELVVNATALKDGSSSATTIDEITDLQKVQEKLVAQIVELDQQVSKQDIEADKKASALWVKILKKLGEFETLNRKFIENMSIRQGIIKFELHEVRQTQLAITQMKGSYARKQPPKGPKDPKSKVNTLS